MLGGLFFSRDRVCIVRCDNDRFHHNRIMYSLQRLFVVEFIVKKSTQTKYITHLFCLFACLLKGILIDYDVITIEFECIGDYVVAIHDRISFS